MDSDAERTVHAYSDLYANCHGAANVNINAPSCHNTPGPQSQSTPGHAYSALLTDSSARATSVYTDCNARTTPAQPASAPLGHAYSA